MRNMTAGSPSTARRIRWLAGVAAILGLATAAEGGVIFHLHGRVQQLATPPVVNELDLTRDPTPLGIPEKRFAELETLCLVDSGVTPTEVSRFSAQAEVWLADFAGRRGLGLTSTQVLGGIMEEYLYHTLKPRIRRRVGLGGRHDEELRKEHRRVLRSAEVVVGPELATAFAQELEQAADGWWRGPSADEPVETATPPRGARPPGE